jgi:hypothetical protein
MNLKKNQLAKADAKYTNRKGFIKSYKRTRYYLKLYHIVSHSLSRTLKSPLLL